VRGWVGVDEGLGRCGLGGVGVGDGVGRCG
jgi:hypothetical protein